MLQAQQWSLVSSGAVNSEDEAPTPSSPVAGETSQTPPEDASDHSIGSIIEPGPKPRSARTAKNTSPRARTRTQVSGRRSGRLATAHTTPQTQSTSNATKNRQPKKAQRKVISKPKAATKAGGREWEVEEVVDSRIDADTYEHFYKVKWRGYSSKENTWEPKTNLSNCIEAIRTYEKLAESKK